MMGARLCSARSAPMASVQGASGQVNRAPCLIKKLALSGFSPGPRAAAALRGPKARMVRSSTICTAGAAKCPCWRKVARGVARERAMRPLATEDAVPASVGGGGSVPTGTAAWPSVPSFKEKTRFEAHIFISLLACRLHVSPAGRARHTPAEQRRAGIAHDATCSPSCNCCWTNFTGSWPLRYPQWLRAVDATQALLL